MLETLKDFVTYGQYKQFEYSADEIECLEHVDAMVESLKKEYVKQLVKPPKHGQGHLRASMLGQNIWLGVWNKFNNPVNFITWQHKRKLIRGLEFEEYTYFLLRRLGYDNIKRQVTVSTKVTEENAFQFVGEELSKELKALCIDDITIEGHPDFVIEVDGEKSILECKEVDNRRYGQMAKEGAGHQYEVQLNFYCEYLGATEAAWLVSNSDTKELMFIGLRKDKEKLYRSIAYGLFLNELQNFNEAYATFPPPVPTRHRSTDYRYVPYYLYAAKGMLHPVVFKLYNVEQNDKGTLVVESYNYPEEYKEFEPGGL